MSIRGTKRGRFVFSNGIGACEAEIGQPQEAEKISILAVIWERADWVFLRVVKLLRAQPGTSESLVLNVFHFPCKG
jgi:hypothetical protein